jgi:L-arabinose isomerase
VLSYDATAEMLEDWCEIMNIEFVHIHKDVTVASMKQQLFLSDLAWKLK